jgi:hypothetical protein
MPNALPTKIAGEEVLLLPEKAIFLAGKTYVVGLGCLSFFMPP